MFWFLPLVCQDTCAFYFCAHSSLKTHQYDHLVQCQLLFCFYYFQTAPKPQHPTQSDSQYRLDLFQNSLCQCYCHTRPILKFQPSLKSEKPQLARWATKWHYFLNSNPPGHPSHRISLWEPFLSNHSSNLQQIFNLDLWDPTKIGDSLNKDDLQWKTTSNGRRPLLKDDFLWKATFIIRFAPWEDYLH